MKTQRYRVWYDVNEFWCIAADHGDGKHRTPFIRASHLGLALRVLKKRLAKNAERRPVRMERNNG